MSRIYRIFRERPIMSAFVLLCTAVELVLAIIWLLTDANGRRLRWWS
jgi:hypothetical protein